MSLHRRGEVVKWILPRSTIRRWLGRILGLLHLRHRTPNIRIGERLYQSSLSIRIFGELSTRPLVNESPTDHYFTVMWNHRIYRML